MSNALCGGRSTRCRKGISVLFSVQPPARKLVFVHSMAKTVYFIWHKLKRCSHCTTDAILGKKWNHSLVNNVNCPGYFLCVYSKLDYCFIVSLWKKSNQNDWLFLVSDQQYQSSTNALWFLTTHILLKSVKQYEAKPIAR